MGQLFVTWQKIRQTINASQVKWYVTILGVKKQIKFKKL